ncbi:MAG: zinc ribbon domain-containing protein [Bacteroidales bacterium]|nr:zinc ribbon domain-containing protein [Lachnoclostridium sp.]MCM1385399.1 zinc ribbon domain-containing protein [Lachnoclostridium sp.]MCM1464119.1 zinc ribbon domain-containing protein [Bacteroidales bacterium]
MRTIMGSMDIEEAVHAIQGFGTMGTLSDILWIVCYLGLIAAYVYLFFIKGNQSAVSGAGERIQAYSGEVPFRAKKFCSQCGTELSGNVVFCGKCGAKAEE